MTPFQDWLEQQLSVVGQARILAKRIGVGSTGEGASMRCLIPVLLFLVSILLTIPLPLQAQTWADVITVENEALRSPYCSVTGEVTNRSRANVTVILEYRAFGSDGMLVGTATAVVEGLPPSGRARFQSTAFFYASCLRIDRWERFQIRGYVLR